MTDFWIAIFSSVGFIYAINVYNVFNIKNSLAETYMNNTLISNCTKWNCFKVYVVAKEKTVKTIKYVKNRLMTNNIYKNIIFVNGGVRNAKYCIEGKKAEKSFNSIPENLDNIDLIIYRAPSTIENIDYDLVRLPLHLDTVKNNKDISYKTYKDKIYSPEISFEYSDESYELDIEKDNYFIVGNKIFDLPFIKWIVKEKYNKNIPETNYTISYLDESMTECTINQNEYLLIKEDCIEKQTNKETESNKENNLANKDESGWGFW